ncbi:MULTISPECIES: hypothetical protein [unclassified Marinimicrobium]|jgi:hypothetical protein|uniref:hypothetical protein n=1 Tax=unclassified Marinimicrobium TaxID=2632100 RepID=UPI000C4F1C75|nr:MULTISPECIES: hypothetical protein [unclassified Marinimicrobium]MAN51185.1 hypothetical protein [Marinimicrobium sp.]|tara:strand:+ start:318 stop:680 length:363 start_codon:yes stop_codon:yes gene_type:complete
MEAEAMLYAWCHYWKWPENLCGQIQLTREMPAEDAEPTAAPIARGTDRSVRLMMQSTAFKKSDGLWVPGFEEGASFLANMNALNAYRNWLANMIKNGSPLKGDVAIWVEPKPSQPTEQPQ